MRHARRVLRWTTVAAMAGFADVSPMSVRAAGDGEWAAVPTEHDDGAPLLFRTLLHPDRDRRWAELFVVAIDASRVRLRSVAGVVDPKVEAIPARSYVRPGVIPVGEQPRVLAAFNGGWKAEHGHFGTTLAPTEDHMVFYRQTPPCLYSGGARHRGLEVEKTIAWGAAVDGEAVIRRSAIGLDERGEVLFVGVSNATTAAAIADGMHHAGAADVAELDVNWSYPKFIVFRTNAAGSLEAESIFPGFVFAKDDYVRRRSPKDFFYLEARN